MAIDVRMGLWWCRWGRSGPNRPPAVANRTSWRAGQAERSVDHPSPPAPVIEPSSCAFNCYADMNNESIPALHFVSDYCDSELQAQFTFNLSFWRHYCSGERFWAKLKPCRPSSLAPSRCRGFPPCRQRLESIEVDGLGPPAIFHHLQALEPFLEVGLHLISSMFRVIPYFE